MLRIGESYYTAIVESNGAAAPFADDCMRRENGMQTTGNLPPKTPSGFHEDRGDGVHAAVQLEDRVGERGEITPKAKAAAATNR